MHSMIAQTVIADLEVIELTPREQGFWLMLLIVLLGVIGVVILVLLAMAWRRFNRRAAAL